MKKLSLKLLAILLTVAMLCSMLPVLASAEEVKKVEGQEISKKAEAIIEADIWDKIDAFEDDNIIETRDDPVDATDYAELSDEIEALVKQSETYVEGSIVRNGAFFTWETSEGIVCGYSPELRYRTRNVTETGNDNTTVVDFGTKAAPSDTDVFLIAPYYGYDSSFTNQYKNEASSIASATGGKYTLYEGTNASITNIANAFQNGGVVIFDSHGTTDYDNGNGNYTARANSSYLCLKTSTGITSADMAKVSGTYGTYYHAFNGGSSTYCVDGTAISNHMTKAAPGTILWMAICLGMATNGLCIPMRNAGVEVVYGYSQSVTFTGDYKYETYFWNKMKSGSDVKTAVSYMKSAAGCNWDPAYAGYSQSQAKAQYAAFPIVVSDQDTYPGQGNVDAVQTVYSTYKLIDSGSGSTNPTTAPTTDPDNGGTADTLVYNLVTSASQLTAGEYIIITVGADGTYYAMSATRDSYACMQSEAVNLTSVASAISCDSATAAAFGFTLKGNANSFTLSNSNGSLYAYSGSDGVGLYYDTASTWTGSYNSSSKGFTLKSGSLYMALRDDISTTGDNGYPLFAVSSSTSTGTTLMHMYKRGDSATCSHSSTSTTTTPATCTTPGSTVVTCDSCGTVVSTTEIPATGHNITYTSNNDGTHALYCSNCGGTGSAECTFSGDTCIYCGYTNSGSTETTGDTYTLVQSAADLTAGEYLILVTPTGAYAGDYTHYVMTTTQDEYSAMQSEGLSFSGLPGGLILDPAGKSTYVFTLNGNANGFTLSNANGSLEGGTSDGNVYLKYGTASTWKATYDSSNYGFTLNNGSVNMVFRDDISTTGSNGAPLFVVDPSTAVTYIMHMYKKDGEESTECTHANTSTSTTAATCTAAGKIVETCDDCGEVINTTTIPALGHDYKYTSNNNGTHKITCSRCTYSSSANCTMVNNTCSYCGYTQETELPEDPTEPEVPEVELTDGQYVIAANVDGVYYAMPNTFASKINGATIKVTNGKVAAADAVGYVIELEETSSGWTISDGNGNYLKYNSSTNLANSTTAYAWTITAGTNGSFRVASTATTTRGLVFRAKTYNQFGGYALANATATSTEYYDVEFLPIDGEISTECTHEGTSTSVIPATCTEDGETVVTCDDCGEVISVTVIPATGHNTTTVTTDATCTADGKTVEVCITCGETIKTTTIPALGHDYKYTSNENGTHKVTCSRCSYNETEDCTIVDNTCTDCGYTQETELPEDPTEPEIPEAELTDGQYVIAANVDGVYYAMANTFASKIDGTPITVTNGKVAAADAVGYVIELEETSSGWTISDGNGNYLKYNSSTNLANSTTAYAWTITAGTNGSFRVASTATTTRGLVFRAKTYNQFGGYALSNATETSTEYYDVEFLPIDGEISTECTHANTSTSTTDATCTEAGKIVVTCDDCGEVIKTTIIPALGHDYKYTSNENGTHKVTCSRCSYNETEDCTIVDNTCTDCGYTEEIELPEDPTEPEVPEIELTEGKYVIAAYVDGVYYAMSNTFASKIDGTPITVTDGKVAASDAEGYVIELNSVDGGWTISDGNGNYIKYNSSTNLGSTTDAYVWSISEGTHGSWRIASAATTTRGLVFRAKTYNQFGGYALSNVTATSAEYYDVELLPIDGEVTPELPDVPEENFNVTINHSLNLASDISINYAVLNTQLEGYSNFYLEVKVPTYEGNTQTGTETVVIEPVLDGLFYYFTMNGLNATQMNDTLEAVLYASKDGKTYASNVDVYSIGTYAYNQLAKTTTTATLKTLCAELLRYGAKAQIFKAYRTNALVDASMTAAHKAMLADLDSVEFGNTNATLNDLANPTVTWGGKVLILDSKITLRYVINPTNYSGNISDLSLRVTYVSLEGETVTETLTGAELYNPDLNYYSFEFSALRAAEVRTVLSAAVYANGKQVSPTLQYSMDTYGNNKTGDLLVVCQALCAYSDAALAYFKG